MTPPEHRTHDRTAYFTVKTPGLVSGAGASSQGPFHSMSSPLSAQAAQPRLSKPSPGAPDVRMPSPNCLGLAVDASADPRDLALLPHENWSSPSCSVKSFAASIPNQLPLDANPEFEAFRRQVDANRVRAAFSLSTSHFNVTSTPSALPRSQPPKRHPHESGGPDLSLLPHHRSGSNARLGFDSVQQDSAHVSADSKRSSSVSLNTPLLPRNTAKHESPPPQPPGTGGPTMMSPAELKDLLGTGQAANVLLLDLRVSPQFAQSRVPGALNLCIPTTLLKRATFDLQKLQQTFQADQDRERFANWPSASRLVVYDASSSDKRDATSAVNMIKKFTNEGYSGPTSILRGGFNAFAAAFPSLIDRSYGGPSPGLSLGASSRPGATRRNVLPVVGGVLLPKTTQEPSPFFNNIRQNQDLVDGVGQMEVGLPPGLAEDSLPRWLREAVRVSDRGKRVSDKFLRIELMEQSRMREAYSIVRSANGPNAAPDDAARVQLSGVEKGGKNRYKDVLPFEHARVKLRDRPEGACDYVNASHLQATRSYKRYIASQGPLPATFEDFWSVVWDHDVRVIVMLTAESEGGQPKCHPYWKGKEFGPIKLRVLSERKVSLDMDKRRSPANAVSTVADGCPGSAADGSFTGLSLSEGARRRANTSTTLESGTQMPTQPSFNTQAGGVAETPCVVIRKFSLSHTAHPFSPAREITQLHYPSWPDFGAPAPPSHLLALVELTNVMQRAAVPIDVPEALTSASVSQHDSQGAAPDATGHFSGQCLSSAGSGRAVGENMPLSPYDGPESNDPARPMLVHCSAGCGRTGTFCTVDSVIDMLKRQRQHRLTQSAKRPDGARRSTEPSLTALDCDLGGDVAMDKRMGGNGVSRAADTPGIDTSWLDDDSIDLIAQTVEDFRGQRLSMVQSLRQFVLCYETVLEWIRRVRECGGSAFDPRRRARGGSLAF